MAAKKENIENTEIAEVKQTFDLQTIGGDLADAIAEEMDGLGTIPFDRVKIPSGGGLAFELPGEDEDHPISSTELVGVIIFHHPVNAYWKEKFAGGNESPDCASIDGKVGVEKETGCMKNCADCEFNKFGSDGDGKACKNAHRVYILREGNPVPLILVLPPTSLKSLRDYIGKKILLKGIRSYEAVTKITLKKEKNASGIAYSRAVFDFVSKLTPEQVAEAKAMAEAVKATDKAVNIDDDYAEAPQTSAPAPQTDADGFMNVPESVDGDLPFC